MSLPPRTIAERFAMLVAGLSLAVAAHTGWDQKLTLRLISGIVGRLRRIKQTFLRLAARIQAGRYRRRAYAPRRPSGPKRPDPLPRARNWLEPMLPEVVHCRGHLMDLLQDPEMVALVQAAPDSLGRPLRSLCRMLGLRPPPILAPPPAPPPPAPPAAPAPRHKPRKTPRPRPPAHASPAPRAAPPQSAPKPA